MRKLVAAAMFTVMVLSGCGASTDGSAEPEGSDNAAASGSDILAEHGLDGLDGMDATEVIDHLDRLGGDERPTDLMASVRSDELLLTSGKREAGMELPADRFYLSVAPYVDETHECFYHSLTTCQGELVGEDIDVTILDGTTGETLVDGRRTTFANGFVGFWLPRDIEGTVRVTYDGKAGQVDFSTGADAPTCLTTLQLT